MDRSIKKLVSNVVKDLQTEKRKDGQQSVWDYFVDRLGDAGAWEKEDLEIIEGKIDARLNALDESSLKELWENSSIGTEKFMSVDKIKIPEMKEDLINEVTDRVMDKLGGIEGDYFRDYSNNPYFADSEKEDGFSEDFDSEPDPGAISGDFEPEDDDIFFDDEDDEY